MSPSALREEIVELTNRLSQIELESSSPGSSSLPRYLAASDLHGNIRRLNEVLATAEREKIDHIFLVGDLYSGAGGWSVFRKLQSLVAADESPATNLTLMWGNHELAFVAGMLGNDRQLRFFYNFGGAEVVKESNAERVQCGQEPVRLSGSERLTAGDLAALRNDPELQQMCAWIQRTHRLFVVDKYGTGYIHAFPFINQHGSFALQYEGIPGLKSLPHLERDLREARSADHHVFSTLLRTETSPVWSLFEISSARQFDQATSSDELRQLVFGHRHHTQGVNVGNFNRQIGIAVDFDQGLGGYLVLGPDGLKFKRFIDRDSQRTEEYELVSPIGQLSARATHLHDIEEFWFRRLVELERRQFSLFPMNSAQARREFTYLESLHQQRFPWIHRLYAELYTHVRDADLRKEMFQAAVESGDEDAFRSFIHLLFDQMQQLSSHGQDWYGEGYLLAKSITMVLMTALRDMPVARLGLLDLPIRGITSRLNLTELYQKILELEDPDLSLLAVQNLGMLRTPESGLALRRAFFHDVRKVRVRAAEKLAEQGETAYPLVAPLLRNSDGWVRCLAMWTLAEMEHDEATRRQAISDICRMLQHESDWFLYMTGKELLRKLRADDDQVKNLPERPQIPNLTEQVIATLQEVVDSEHEPFRKAFKVYFITIELSSLVYRRGLVGLDIDDLRFYVNDDDYFPPYYRHYKSGDVDIQGAWRGWRRLWIRGETLNFPDGPHIIELDPAEAGQTPPGPQTMVLYDHRMSHGRVELPPLERVIEQHGLGKVKDRNRAALLEQWDSAFSFEEQVLICRIHAAAVLKMLFDLPAQITASRSDWEVIQALNRKVLSTDSQRPKRVIKLVASNSEEKLPAPASERVTIQPQWLDALKYSVTAIRSE